MIPRINVIFGFARKKYKTERDCKLFPDATEPGEISAEKEVEMQGWRSKRLKFNWARLRRDFSAAHAPEMVHPLS